MSVEISAEAAVRLGSQIEDLTRLLGVAMLAAPRIRVLKHTKTAAASAATWTFIEVTPGAVPDGRVYDLRSVVVAGDDPSAQLASTAVCLFRFTDLPADGSTCPSNLDLLFPANGNLVPQRILFARGQAALRPGDHVGVGIKGLGNNVNVHVSATALDWDEASALAWIAP